MADEEDRIPERLPGETHGSFENLDVPIGAGPDGKIEVFPLADLPAILARIAEEEDATTYAIEQSDAGFPKDGDDLSDLDEIEALFDDDETEEE